MGFVKFLVFCLIKEVILGRDHSILNSILNRYDQKIFACGIPTSRVFSAREKVSSSPS